MLYYAALFLVGSLIAGLFGLCAGSGLALVAALVPTAALAGLGLISLAVGLIRRTQLTA